MGRNWARIVGLVAALAGSAPSPAVAAEWITFDALPLESGSAAPAAGAANPVRAYLAPPVEAGPHPGVVLLPDCTGQQPYQQTWARALAARGHAALLIDHYFLHDQGTPCDERTQVVDRQMRLRHMQTAIRYLAAVDGVDGSRIAVLGWGDAPLLAALEAGAAEPDAALPIVAVVAITPGACPPAPPPGNTPWLALIAGRQPASGAPACLSPPAGVEVSRYPDAYPGFDDPRADEDGAASPVTGAARHYDRLAHARAIDEVGAFLGRHLAAAGATGSHGYSSAAVPDVEERGTWAVDPADPGPDLPPAGASLFDRVFSRASAEGPVFDLPFPFEALTAKLEHAAGGPQMPRSPLDAALVPLGRSLQREAAAPEYFASPRIVVAVTGAPAHGPLPRVYLAGRLFLGYQPRAEVLEVISYNEEAVRFEFQVVRDYRAGATPQVRYARRALCTSCHQNGAPIFSEASWEETNANPRIVARLRALGDAFHGVPVRQDGRGVAAIDSATDEANLFPVLQRLWREGCAGSTPVATAACRAGAVQAMLQYRLSGGSGFDRDAALYVAGYLAVQKRNWQDRWPDGLLVPSSTLPDRAPLMLPLPSSIPVAQDPLRRRPPDGHWAATSRRDLERMVRGLAHELPAQHVAAMDRRLREIGANAAPRTLTAPCEVLPRGVGTGTIEIECTAGGDARAGFNLRAVLRESADRSVEGSVGWLDLAGGFYERLRAAGAADAQADVLVGERRVVVRLARRDDGAPVRAPSGESIDAFVVRWDPAAGVTDRRWRAEGEIRLVDDFAPLGGIVSRAAAGAVDAAPLHAPRFAGRTVSAWLLRALGVPPETGCCEGPGEPTPAPIAEAGTATARTVLSAALDHLGPLQTFERYCGACHGNDTRYPPGFLHGDAATRRETVAQCAERIFYRLSMWRRPPAERGATPMPPAQGLHIAGTDGERWRQGPSLARLIAYVGAMVDVRPGGSASVLEGPYEGNRPCLPAPAAVPVR